jgi:predicted kinase
MRKIIYISIGIPGCGKSTWFSEHRKGLDPMKYALVNMDTIRQEVTGDPTDQSKNTMVAAVARQHFLTAVSHSVPIIYWDNTTTQRKYRKELIEVGKRGGYDVVAVYFNIPFDTCVKRNNMRNRVVPKDVLIRMKNQIQVPSMDEGWSEIITVKE